MEEKETPSTEMDAGGECAHYTDGKEKAVGHQGHRAGRPRLSLIYPALKAMLSTLVHLASLEASTPLPLEELIPHLKAMMLSVGW